jgi:hypothetical protein
MTVLREEQEVRKLFIFLAKDRSIEDQKELISFLSKIEKEMKETPGENPLTRMNFITNWSGQNLQLTNSAMHPDKQATAESETTFIPGNNGGSYQAQPKKSGRGLPALPAAEPKT